VLNYLQNHENYFISSFLVYLSKCVEKTWQRAEPKGAFFAYSQNLNMLLDILLNIDVKKMPPALFELIVYQLNQLIPFIGKDLGKGWDAQDTWDRKKVKIPDETVKEIYQYAEIQQLPMISILFKELLKK